ncbi:glucosaminidase domain-containing protein [Amedibacillus dolichus]|uniref:Glucosaminidase domain-containing protein n=1 Tax=Amedibacillus dolichus TaxID=31971 RepID=A0ABT7U9G4_9FIRM|nr:glucosaminidase domain-containing protein [Amedibacillus dolichus]MDM8156273.1 glucosaminidase domain-containing protein [Amedibacillus dolichus]
MKKGIVLCACALALTIGCIWGNTMMANEASQAAVGASLPKDHVFTTIDENGRLVEMDVEQMEEETAQEQEARKNMEGLQVGGVRDLKYGVVNFRTKSSASLNTNYVDAVTGESGYTNGYYAADAAFLGYENGKVKFMLSGVVGLVNASEVEVLDATEDWYVSFYRCEQGVLKHYIKNSMYGNSYSSAITVGEMQSYMKNNVYYYSYDGHYFYTDYIDMLDDYLNDTRANAINADEPYYNYYQFVSNRSKTGFTADDINNYVKYYLGSSYTSAKTKMYQMGQYYIQYQNQYGANALAVFGVSANESAFGTSNIAKTKNNLFGHNAVDSDPDMANGYSSPQNSIKDHAKYYVNLWYSTPKYSTYHGSFLGDKASGMLSYASDPYWGEKAAHWAWSLDLYTKDKSDVGKETLVFKDAGAVNVRKEPSTSSTVLYTTPENANMSFVLLDEVKGSTVSGSDVWYKIQLDVPLNSNRTAIDYSGDKYDFAKSYGYIHSSLLSKDVLDNDSGGGSGDGGSDSGAYKKGDVNNDGKLTPADYVKVKNHIMGNSKLSGKALTAADMNKDGKVTPADYVKIKNEIMNK